MVTFEQLRISDDGQSLFIDAHVNKASYFDDVYLKSITICTEDQVSESDPLSYGEDFIYQANIVSIDTVHPLYDKVKILSENQLVEIMQENGGWHISYDTPVEAENPAISIVLSGKFSVLDSDYAPKLVVATSAFNPQTDYLNNPEVLFTVDGVHYSEQGHDTWRFTGKGFTNNNPSPCFYLYKQETSGNYSYVRLDETDDVNFLHFLWQVWYIESSTSQKEVHLVLNKNGFNEKFTAGDLSHNMFFVYIECEGTPAPDTPCRLDEMTTLGVTFDYGVIFNQAMGYTRELSDDCQMPKGFIDFILNYDALKLAIETDHWIPAIGFWKGLTQSLYFEHGGNGGVTKPCGCHG